MRRLLTWAFVTPSFAPGECVICGLLAILLYNAVLPWIGLS